MIELGMPNPNLYHSLWTKQKLAERLEISPNLLQIGIVDKALEILQNSPLLKTGPFPRIPKRNPRKRDDYKCGICGKKKRNHVCHNSGGIGNDHDNLSNYGLGGGVGDGIGIKKESVDDLDDGFGNDDDDDDDGGVGDLNNSYAPPSKKRKKVFKPLVLVMQNDNPTIQQFLEQVSLFGEKNVEARLTPLLMGENMNTDFEIVGEIIINGNVVNVGKISDYYKEMVKKSMDDHTLVKIELAPLTKMYNTFWLVQFILHRNSSWRTKKNSMNMTV